jgi:hypothetical protein
VKTAKVRLATEADTCQPVIRNTSHTHEAKKTRLKLIAGKFRTDGQV